MKHDDLADKLKLFEAVKSKLHDLIDTNPAKAIEEARALEEEIFLDLKAGILVDAGSCLRDKAAISEGLSTFRKLVQDYPKRSDFHYNLGNALIALADTETVSRFEWHLATHDRRQEARSCFQKALSLKGSERIASVALTNLGNALWTGYRWAEAYDAYAKALGHDSTNAVALTGAAKILLRCIERGIGDPKVLLSVTARHLEIAKMHPDRIKDLAGAQALKKLSGLLKKPLKGSKMPNLSHAGAYEKFVASYRLMLSPTIEGLDISLKRWDSLIIHSIIEPVKGHHGIPALFAMFNVMKSDFLLARHLAYQALSSDMPDSGFYSDTLDYALYGVKSAALALSQRACMDVLDKIAVATAEYFEIKGKDIYFSSFWFERKKGQPLAWNPALNEHIKVGNTGIIALGELSLDLGEKGFLHEKRSFRSAATHQFIVLHDEGCTPSRESEYINHCKVYTFESMLIESLQLTRAALLYFIDVVQIGEAQKHARSGGKTIPLPVPSHHYIRGQDEDKSEDPD